MPRLFSNHIDRHSDCLRRHAGILVAGLVVQLGLHKMIPGGRNNVRLDHEFAAVNEKLLTGIDWQRKVGARRIAGARQPNTRRLRNRKHRWNQVIRARRMRVDVQILLDAKVERYFTRLARGYGDLFGEKILYGFSLMTGPVRRCRE